MAPRLRILFVEDNDDLAWVMVEVLKLLGHSVQHAASATEAIPYLDNEQFSVLLTDIAMPGMSGIALAGRRETSNDSDHFCKCLESKLI